MSGTPESPPSFVCCCCGGTESEPAGSYALPPRRGEAEESIGLSYDLAQCTACGHVSAHPLPSEDAIGCYYASNAFWAAQGADLEETDIAWRDKVTSTSGLWERYRRGDRQLDFAVRSLNLGPDANIIDLGSGYSPFLQRCRERGFGNLFALEPSDEVCSYLEKQGVTAYPQLLEDFVVRDDLPKFDLMMISHTVEHLIDPSQVFEGLRRHLKPGGALYVDVPYRDDLRPYHQGVHLQFFNENSMSRLAATTGFTVRSIEHDRFNPLEKILISLLYAIYGKVFRGSGGVGANPKIEFLHKAFWRPVKRLLGLKINIFISSMDLRALLTPAP